MIGRRVANFSKFVLRPLNLLLPLVALIYFFQKAWFVGVYFLFVWFCVGVIGQSIHKDKSFGELARGGLTAEPNIRPDSNSPGDTYELAKPLMYISWLTGITVGVILFHYGFRWFVSIPIGFCIAIVSVTALAIIFARPKG